tara:strand:+ start:79877 stop:80983 length:1107 start_codon:yes stop_codon:yes gene_type:complete
MKTYKKLVAGALLASALVSQAVAQEAVKLGVIFPTRTIIGEQAVHGAELAAKQINDAGGILDGRMVELIVYDSNFSAVDGVSAAQRLLTQDGVKYILGEISSTVAFAVIPVVESEEALAMLAMPKHPDVTNSGYENVFRLNSTSQIDAASFGKYLTETVKPEKVAVLVQNDDIGLTSLEQMKQLFGEKVVFSDIFDVKQADFSALATNVRASGADLVCVTAANPEQSGGVFRSMADVGYSPKRCLLPGYLNNDLPDVAGAAAEGVFSQDVYIDTIDSELNNTFVKEYLAAQGKVPGKPEVLGFETVWIVAKAIDAAGSYDDVSKVAKVIRDTQWESPRGKLRFNEIGQALTEKLYNTVVKDGRVVRAD